MVTFKGNMVRIFLSVTDLYLDGIFVECENYNGVHAVLISDPDSPQEVSRVVPYDSIAYIQLLGPGKSAAQEKKRSPEEALQSAKETLSANTPIAEKIQAVRGAQPTLPPPMSIPSDNTTADQLLDFDNEFVNPTMSPAIPVNYGSPSDIFDIDIGPSQVPTQPYFPNSTVPGTPPLGYAAFGPHVPSTTSPYQNNAPTPSGYPSPDQIPFIRPR